MGELIQNAVALALDVLEVADQMALHALPPGERALHQQRHFAWEQRLRPLLLRQFPLQIFPVKDETLLERDAHAVDRVVRVGRLRFAPAVAHVDLLVGVQDKEIDGIVPVAVE